MRNRIAALIFAFTLGLLTFWAIHSRTTRPVNFDPVSRPPKTLRISYPIPDSPRRDVKTYRVVSIATDTGHAWGTDDKHEFEELVRVDFDDDRIIYFAVPAAPIPK